MTVTPLPKKLRRSWKLGVNVEQKSPRTMTIQKAIARAEALLPGIAAPDGEIDPRWQAIIDVGEFIESDPAEVWAFIIKWGRAENCKVAQVFPSLSPG
jgi:hypothetical protein